VTRKKLSYILKCFRAFKEVSNILSSKHKKPNIPVCKHGLQAQFKLEPRI